MPKQQEFAIPFTYDADAGFATIDATSNEAGKDRVLTLLRTPVGALEWLPDYGRDFDAFPLNGIDASDVLDLVAKWEHEADVDVVAGAVVDALQEIRAEVSGG